MTSQPPRDQPDEIVPGVPSIDALDAEQDAIDITLSTNAVRLVARIGKYLRLSYIELQTLNKQHTKLLTELRETNKQLRRIKSGSVK